jgi:hypothetical protein
MDGPPLDTVSYPPFGFFGIASTLLGAPIRGQPEVNTANHPELLESIST